VFVVAEDRLQRLPDATATSRQAGTVSNRVGFIPTGLEKVVRPSG
jgi:hypothetical protein